MVVISGNNVVKSGNPTNQGDIMSSLVEAIGFLGSQKKAAQELSNKTGLPVSQQKISSWVKKGKIPAEFVIPLEELTESKFTRFQLRPDIYPESQEARI